MHAAVSPGFRSILVLVAVFCFALPAVEAPGKGSLQDACLPGFLAIFVFFCDAACPALVDGDLCKGRMACSGQMQRSQFALKHRTTNKTQRIKKKN